MSRFWQELKSVSQAAKLLNSLVTRIRVLRDKKEVELHRKEVVPGDVLVLTGILHFSYIFALYTNNEVSPGGDVFPGDCVLFMSEGLTVAQASLTGEMIPVDKTTRLGPPPADYNFDIIHNDNICLAGTSVATGSGHAMVISTGDNTYMASIAKDLAKKRPLNAMQIGIRKVSYLLLTFMAVMSPIVFVIQGGLSHDWRSAIFFAISIAVGITPEMLPMIVVRPSFLVSF
jgi:P-type Mg2+ transporter